ncbi:MAG: hypothetical protein ACP5KE_04240 [Candidatus Methanodesulfokora sp.]
MEEVIYYVVSFSLTIIGMLAGIAYWLGRKFAEIDRTLAEMRRDFSRAIDGMKSAVVSANSLILDFMAMKKLLEDKDTAVIPSTIDLEVISTDKVSAAAALEVASDSIELDSLISRFTSLRMGIRFLPDVIG